jgi:hypothetical protein
MHLCSPFSQHSDQSQAESESNVFCGFAFDLDPREN